MADEGMSWSEAQDLAAVVQEATARLIGVQVEVKPEDIFFVVAVRRATPGDSYWLRDEDDWQWLGPRILEAE